MLVLWREARGRARALHTSSNWKLARLQVVSCVLI